MVYQQNRNINKEIENLKEKSKAILDLQSIIPKFKIQKRDSKTYLSMWKKDLKVLV